MLAPPLSYEYVDGGKGDLPPDLILSAGVFCAAFFHPVLSQWSPHLHAVATKGEMLALGPAHFPAAGPFAKWATCPAQSPLGPVVSFKAPFVPSSSGLLFKAFLYA